MFLLMHWEMGICILILFDFYFNYIVAGNGAQEFGKNK